MYGGQRAVVTMPALPIVGIVLARNCEAAKEGTTALSRV